MNTNTFCMTGFSADLYHNSFSVMIINSLMTTDIWLILVQTCMVVDTEYISDPLPTWYRKAYLNHIFLKGN